MFIPTLHVEPDPTRVAPDLPCGQGPDTPRPSGPSAWRLPHKREGSVRPLAVGRTE